VNPTIINGTEISRIIREEIATEVAVLKSDHNLIPGLAVVLVGDDPASAVYVRNKGRACEEVGIYSETINLPSTTTQSELLNKISDLNQDPRFHGVLVQLPLPTHISQRSIILSLDPKKDVDGLHPINVGRLVEGNPNFIPCTPAGIQQLLMRSGQDPAGKHLVVCGRSDIVGKPIAIMMMQKQEGANATVTICHTGTKNLGDITRSADILVAAIGRPRSITADMVTDGVVVIDVGINRVEDSSRRSGYRLVGDVDFEEVSKKSMAITPVPGGVGPMTIAMLLTNTVKAARLTLETSN
jgi:methylenetetrahydrofolate dehydrogenase (NADP+)/methenyltetrahydrofolate cyclohydrolase